MFACTYKEFELVIIFFTELINKLHNREKK